MNVPQSITLSAITVALLVSCSSSGDGSGGEAPSLAPMSQRMNQNHGYEQDAKGNWIPRHNKRSQFDGRNASGIPRRNTMADRRFGANEYQTSEWTRTSSAPPQSYSGDTDGSRFQTTSAADGQTARQSGTRARIPGEYRTGHYGTSDARESAARRHDRPGHAHTENRRASRPPPEIIDWRQQRDITIEQSRSILSR